MDPGLDTFGSDIFMFQVSVFHSNWVAVSDFFGSGSS